MHKLTIANDIAVYSNTQELDTERLSLLQRAREAAANAYAPYSNFKVGSAVLLDNGQIVIGSNQENASYPLTMCAERNALASAASQYPTAKILRVAITIISTNGNIMRPVSPCGACRQVIYENEFRTKHDIELILQGDGGEVYVMPTVKTILPLMFDATFL